MAPRTPQGLLVGSRGTPIPPPWHPHSTVFNQLTLYPLANLVPFTGNTSTSPLLWRASSYPQFAFQFQTEHTQSHTSSNSTKAYLQELSNQRAENTPESQSSFIAAIYRQWSCLQLCQLCQSASCSVLTLFWDFSLSHYFVLFDPMSFDLDIIY